MNQNAIYYGLFTLGLVTVFFTNIAKAITPLGESVISVESKSGTAHPVFSIQELQSGQTPVREYISSSNIVFGITWKGSVHPDLRPLLGTFTADYDSELKHSPRNHGQRYKSIKTGKVIVEKWGHMRNLQGRAYIPALIPNGVTINDIK